MEPGEAIRYRGLGAGLVIRHEEREFQGSLTVFAVIEFPHRDMTAQIPLGDENFAHQLRPVASATSMKKILGVLAQPGNRLSRTWDGREEYGLARLRDGSPIEWAELLRDYASARKHGMIITSSDSDLVRETIKLLAAEHACASRTNYAEALLLIQTAYDTASKH